MPFNIIRQLGCLVRSQTLSFFVVQHVLYQWRMNVAESLVGCLLYRVAVVLLSRGSGGGDVRALTALVISLRSCASLLARCL